MKTFHIVLVVCLILAVAGTAMAQVPMDNSMDPNSQSQMNQTSQGQVSENAQGQNVSAANLTATVQPGPVMYRGGPASADVFVGGRLAIRVASSAGGYSPMQRAQIIAGRLNNAFASGNTWSDMRVQKVNGESVIVARNNMPIATIDSMSACAYGVSASNLANRWVRETRLAMQGFAQSQVAGRRQEIGMQTKTVPLLSADTGQTLANVMIQGPASALAQTNSVVVYQSTSGNATIWSFVPITGTSTTGSLSRVSGVGLVSVPQSLVPTAGMMSGTDAMNAVNTNGGQWNSTINASLAQNNLQFTSSMNSKVVPLYSIDSGQVIGAAQISGDASSVNNVQSVAVSAQGDMWQFNPSSGMAPTSSNMGPVAGNVTVSSIIMTQTPTQAVPPAEQPQTTEPAPTTTPAPAPETTMPGTTTPNTNAPGTTTPGNTPSY